MPRCPWATTEPAITYHDEEWGVPLHDDRMLFEFLILEGAQAGLSWITILKPRSCSCGGSMASSGCARAWPCCSWTRNGTFRQSTPRPSPLPDQITNFPRRRIRLHARLFITLVAIEINREPLRLWIT